MRCVACNKTLKEYEAVRKDEEGDYIDLCGTCYRYSRSEDVYRRDDKVEVDEDLTNILTNNENTLDY